MSQQNASGSAGNASSGAANVLNEFFRTGPLLLDGRVPFLLKLLPIAAAIYWFWPVDLMPGLPFDDIAVLLVVLHFFVKLANEAIDRVQQGQYAQQATAGAGAGGDASVVDTTWRVID